MYIKALEQEVLRLKETVATTSRERDAIAEENRRLKDLLLAHGISYDLSSPNGSGFGGLGTSTYGGSSTGSVSGAFTHSTGYTSPPDMGSQQGMPLSGGGHMTHGSPTHTTPVSVHHPQQQQQNGGAGGPALDYDQIGIDFVLTYDRTPYLSPPPQQ